MPKPAYLSIIRFISAVVGVELVPGVEEESSLGRILLPPSGSLLILFGGLGVGRGGAVPEQKMYFFLITRISNLG